MINGAFAEPRTEAAAPARGQAVALEDLRFEYPDSDFRLWIPEFKVAYGERVAVVGPSGSGKTTLLLLLAGIKPAQAGTLRVDGRDLPRLSDRERRDFRSTSIGFIFQDFELIEYLDVLDNILHPYRISGALRLNEAIRVRATQLASELGIGAKLRRQPHELSQGEKQRAAICRALLPAPRIILADEPTGNLDPDNKVRILERLFASVAARGASLIAVTHDLELLPRFDRVIDFRRFTERPQR
jgi:ABC-type lipoprotein export system ATPase subunit